jgi:hypothetical protein
VNDSFTITKNCKQLKCPPKGAQINKLWYVLTKEDYLAIKQNQVLDTVTWMILKIIMLNDKKTNSKENVLSHSATDKTNL